MWTVKLDSKARRPCSAPSSDQSPARRSWLTQWLGLSLLVALSPAAIAGKAAAVSRPATILVLGDSLSAEYGLARGTGWVALLGEKLPKRADLKVINASISGETTSGGLTRLPALLKQHHPTHVVIELGANDALRGLPLNATKANLSSLVRQSRQAGAKVVLVGMALPPNFGKRYGEEFAAIYPAVAASERAAVVPFFLKGIADRADARDWFQADGIHPVAKAHPIMLGNVWQALGPML
jgi:acyl-CoA thioesterase-1